MDTIGSLDVCKAASSNLGCPPNGVVSALQNSASPTPIKSSRHLARQLVQIGLTDVFSVPGDFNLTLLDRLIAKPKLELIGCCKELNTGYAADGYPSSRGVGACVVTFTVGGLSVLNAIAVKTLCPTALKDSKPVYTKHCVICYGSTHLTHSPHVFALLICHRNIPIWRCLSSDIGLV